MARLIRSPEAEADLDEIIDRIAADNPSAAFSWLKSMQRLVHLLSRQPEIGERFKSRRFGELRRFPHGNYIIYYRPLADGVEVLRVVHGARDQERQI